jgi:hypothetical protein
MAGQPLMGQGLLTVDALRSHSSYHTQWESSVRMIGPSQRFLPDNTQLSQKTDIHVLGGIRTHNPGKRMTADMSSAGFELTIPASEWPQTQALDRAATGIGTVIL